MEKTGPNSFKARITYVPRNVSASPKRVKPSSIGHENNHHSTPNTDDFVSKPIQSPCSTQKSAQTHKTNRMVEPDTPLTPDMIRSTTAKSKVAEVPSKKPSLTDKMRKSWQNLSPAQKLAAKIGLGTILFLSICTVAIVPPVMVLVVNKPNMQSSFTNLTASVCASTTCIGAETPYQASTVNLLYAFDGNFNDLSGYATGIGLGLATPSFSGNCYVGSQSLTLLGSIQQQYVQIPFVNLAQKSFTIEAWIYVFTTSLVADYGIFGQCDSNSNCLSISLRNGRFALSFDAMNSNNNTLLGSTILSQQNVWMHLAIVYDAVLYQQQIYTNGQIDAISRGIVSPFSVTSTSAVTTIGRAISSPYGTTYFYGRVDHFLITAGTARTACQIYNDAALVAHFPFDSVGTWNDYSVNLFNGLPGSLTQLSVGRVGQAIYFGTSTSYFQSECFTSIQTNNPPFTVALWINAASPTTGGSIVHLSTLSSGLGTYCYDLLALTSTGNLVVQLLQALTVVNATQGPVLTANAWTHVAVLYGVSNGVRIFINGQLTAISQSTGSIGMQAISDPQYVTLGNYSPLGLGVSLTCRNGSISYIPGPFTGAIDDFRLYNRELTNQEICTLANM